MVDRSAWPWITTKVDLIERVSDHHREAKQEEFRSVALSSLNPDLQPKQREEIDLYYRELESDLKGPTLSEGIDAGHRALELSGHEIATAKDHDSASAAKLKYEFFEHGQDEMIDALLDLAHRVLQHRRVSEDYHPEDVSWLVGYGRRAPGAPLEIIKPVDWEAGTPDWQRWHLQNDEGIAFRDIRLLDLRTLDAAIYREVIFDLAEEPMPGEQCPRPGRPSRREQIDAAISHLGREGKITPEMRKIETVALVRSRVIAESGDAGPEGLGDETIKKRLRHASKL